MVIKHSVITFAHWILWIIIFISLIGITDYNSHHSIHDSSYHVVNMANKLQYTSQFTPVDIPGSCEAASLKMALSIKGKARNISLNQLVHKIGWYTGKGGNPNLKYSNNPYKSDNGATMYPPLLAHWAEKLGAHAQIINYAQPDVLEYYLNRHDPIIVEAGHDMQHHWYDDHILCLIGYKKTKHQTYLEYTDSLYYHRDIQWCTLKQFEQAYWRPNTTGCRAVVVK